MEVERISEEIIKPYSPTPPHQQFLKISLIDKLMPPAFIPFVSFYQYYPNNNSITHDHLKFSLSQTLIRFYPLAGRLKDDDITIDCNDEGVVFTTARVVNITLSELLRIKNPIFSCFTNWFRN